MDSRDRRGQLLLVAGLGLAAAFVVLALVLNAVVFTENLATRNHGPADGAVGYERGVERGVDGLLARTNAENASDYGTLRTALRANVAAWDADAATLSAAAGRVTAVSLAAVENGTRVVQSDRRAFTNASGDPDWTAAAGVNETRGFELVATPDGGDPLTVTVSDGSASWRVAVAENDTNTGSTDVEVTNGTGAVLAAVTVESDIVDLDVTEGTVNGSTVEGWTYAEGVGAPYNVSVGNGGDATGRYGLVVDRPRPALLDALPDGTYYDRSVGVSPTTTPALYRATVDVTVRNSRVTYGTALSVAPGSLPGGLADGEPPDVPAGVLFADDDTGRLTWATQFGSTAFDATDVEVLGPLRDDFDGDDRTEVPYVDGTGALRLVDAANDTATWRTSGADHPPVTSQSRLAVGAWQGTPPAVLYPGTSSSRVYAAWNASGPSVELHGSDDGVGAVSGVADVDGDGADELVFGGSSQQLRYLDDDGAEIEIDGGGYGKNNAPGIGTPADFDGDGVPRIPFVDGSNNLDLVDADGTVEQVVSSGNVTVAKSPVAVADWDRDGDPEIVFVASGGDLWYADDVASGGTPVEIDADLDGDGDDGVDVDTGVGVA